jgi:ubiquitin-protein ligase
MESKSNVKIQNNRISKEVKMLKNLPPEMLFGKIEKDYGVLIRIEIKSSLVKSQLLNTEDNKSRMLEPLQASKLYFEILLTEKFPFQAPQVYCKTKIGYPTIDDKRDVLEEILQKEWSPSMTIYETIQLIPDFVSEVLLQMTQDEEIRSIGKWHLGQSYHVTDWGVGFFKVREETETLDGFQYHDRYIAVCENSFFLFEPDTKGKDMAKLLSVATLCSLEKISRNLDMPEHVTFYWRKLENQKEQWVLKVEIQNYVE